MRWHQHEILHPIPVSCWGSDAEDLPNILRLQICLTQGQGLALFLHPQLPPRPPTGSCHVNRSQDRQEREPPFPTSWSPSSHITIRAVFVHQHTQRPPKLQEVPGSRALAAIRRASGPATENNHLRLILRSERTLQNKNLGGRPTD